MHQIENENNDMKYNYVVIGSENDFYKVSYSDLENCANAKYLWRQIDTTSALILLLYKLHTSPRTNKYLKLPGKKIWNKWIFREKFDNDNPICFIFFASRDREIKNGVVPYLKEHYKNCKVVLFYQDIVKKSKLPDLDVIRKQFDIILSFDQMDVKKYDLIYYPLVYSKSNVAENTVPSSDVYFLGKAKDRYDKIIAVYKKCREAGLRCDFHIVGVEPEKQQYKGEIEYNRPMSYYENLHHIYACKCMLEVMQNEGHGYTLRYCEAIMYDKKIITDNPEISKAPFYSGDRIQVFNDPDDIEIEFIDKENYKVDYNYKEELSPIKLLEFLDRRL